MRTSYLVSGLATAALVGTLGFHEDLPFLPARKSGEEWQLVVKRRYIPSWFTKALPGRAGFFTLWCKTG